MQHTIGCQPAGQHILNNGRDSVGKEEEVKLNDVKSIPRTTKTDGFYMHVGFVTLICALLLALMALLYRCCCCCLLAGKSQKESGEKLHRTLTMGNDGRQCGECGDMYA